MSISGAVAPASTAPGSAALGSTPLGPVAPATTQPRDEPAWAGNAAQQATDAAPVPATDPAPSLPAAPDAASAGLAPDASGGHAPTTRPRPRAWIAAALAGVLLLGAVAAAVALWPDSGPQQLSMEESQRRVDAALSQLPQDLEDGGAMRTMAGTMRGDDGLFGGTIHFTTEWGLNGVAKATVEMREPGILVQATLYCSPESIVIVFGHQIVEERNHEQDCGFFGDDLAVANPLAAFMEEGYTVESTTPHGDGTVTAVIVDEQLRVRLKLDAQGRLSSLEGDMGDLERTFEMRFSYGARRAISLPEDAVRAPADVYGLGRWHGAHYTWEAWSGDAPVSEFEVRVLDAGEVIVRFPLIHGAATADGVAFEFFESGDGLLGAGDRFNVTTDPSRQVVVWDLWADRDIEDDVDVPGPPLALLLGAIVLARRLHRA